MKAIISEEFKYLSTSVSAKEYFSVGVAVEILKVINDTSFDSGLGYVVYNPYNQESASLDAAFVELIK